MKKILFLLFVAVVLSACSGSSPSDVTKSFNQALADGKYDEAKKYATESVAGMIDLVENMAKMAGKTKLKEDFEYTCIKDSVAGDKAWVTYTTGKDDPEQTAQLVKVNGEWKVDL